MQPIIDEVEKFESHDTNKDSLLFCGYPTLCNAFKSGKQQFLAFCVNYSFKKLLLLEITFFTFFQREHNRKKISV